MSTYTPPSDLTAERSVIGGCMLNPDALDLVGEMLTPASFYHQANGLVWRAMLELRKKGDEVDHLTVESYLRGAGKLAAVGGVEHLISYTDVIPSYRAIETYAKTVVDRAAKRALLSAAQEGMRYALDGDLNAEEAIAKTRDDLERAATLQVTEGHTVHLRDAVTTWYEEIANRNAEDTFGVTTGLRDLDEFLNGLQKRALYVLAARPGMGKTALMLQVLLAAAADGPCHAISIEMSNEELVERSVSNRGGVAVPRMRSRTFSDADMTRMVTAADVLTRLDLSIDDNPRQTIESLRASCYRHRARNGGKPPRLIAIDYIQKMDTGAAESREQGVAEIARGLKSLAREMDCPVLALAQINRGNEGRTDKRPRMSDLRESGAIEQEADAVLFIYRDDYYNRDSASAGTAEIIIDKNRAGKTGVVKVAWDGWCTRFRDIDDGDEEFSDDG